MSPEVIEALVRLVANGRKFGVADTVVIEHLLEMGVPKEHAQDLLAEITHGLQHGARLAAANPGEPSDIPPSSPLYTAAVAEGRRSAVATVAPAPTWPVLMVVALALAGFLIYLIWR